MKTKLESKDILTKAEKKYEEDREFISRFIEEVYKYKPYIKLKIEVGKPSYEFEDVTTGDTYNVNYIIDEDTREWKLYINKAINKIQIPVGNINLSQQIYETTRLSKFLELLKIYTDIIHDDFASSLEDYISDERE